MNTKESDSLIKAWHQRAVALERFSFTCRKTFKTSPEVLFPLLCPTTEFDWLPGFECELLHSKSGYAEYNAIFSTNVFGPEEIWVCTRYEANKAVDYSSVCKESCGKLDITLVDNYDGTVTGTWVVTKSALCPDIHWTKTEIEEGRARLAQIIDWLDHYVVTGEMAS